MAKINALNESDLETVKTHLNNAINSIERHPVITKEEEKTIHYLIHLEENIEIDFDKAYC